MAEEIKKEAPAGPSVADLKKINEELSQQLLKADAEVQAARNAQKAAEARAEKAERKLKDQKAAAPASDVVVLDGKPWAIKGTVHAKFALEEVKRGHIHEDVVLVITDKPA